MESIKKKNGAIFKGEPIHLGEHEAVQPSHSYLSRRAFLKGATGIAASALAMDQLASWSQAVPFREYIPYDASRDAHYGHHFGWIEHHHPSPESNGEQFVFVRLKYPGGDWFTNAVNYYRWPADTKFTEMLARYTSVDVELHENPQYVSIEEDDIDYLCNYPFLFMTGHLGVRFSEEDIRKLREYLERGGFLHVEDCDIRIDRMRPAVYRLMQQIFPDQKFERLDMSHPIYHTLYDHDEYLGGDKRVAPHGEFDEAIMIDDRIAVYFCPSDLNCAWEGRVCEPDGEEQRRWAFEQGMNVVTYALTH